MWKWNIVKINVFLVNVLEIVLVFCSYKEKINNKINLLKDESWIILNDDIYNDDYLFYFKIIWIVYGFLLIDIFCF